MVKAVIFDVDGLLIDSEPFWRRAQLYAFGTVGVKLTNHDLRLTMGRRIDEVVAHWYHVKPWTGASQKDIEAIIIKKVIELVVSEGKPMPGVKSILDFFDKKGLPMAIASSSSEEIMRAVVDKLKIKDYFKQVYSAENEILGKPHPGVYITTATLLGVPVHSCLAFEDSPSGVLAAKTAKMKCVAIPDADHKSDENIQIADMVLDSLEVFDEKIFSTL